MLGYMIGHTRESRTVYLSLVPVVVGVVIASGAEVRTPGSGVLCAFDVHCCCCLCMLQCLSGLHAFQQQAGQPWNICRTLQLQTNKTHHQLTPQLPRHPLRSPCSTCWALWRQSRRPRRVR